MSLASSPPTEVSPPAAAPPPPPPPSLPPVAVAATVTATPPPPPPAPPAPPAPAAAATNLVVPSLPAASLVDQSATAPPTPTADADAEIVQAPVTHPGIAQPARAPSRLVPLLLFRVPVIVSYLAAAAAFAWLAAVVSRVQPEVVSGAISDASEHSYDRAIAMASLAYVAVLFAHVFWSIGAAWNARRCTLLAPAPLGIALCVLLGPLAATATYVASGSDEFAAVLVAFILGHVGLMISVNLLGRAVQSLGRSAAAFKPWGTLLALQMVMSMAFYKAIDMAGQGDISAEWLFQIYTWLVAGAALAFAGAGLFAWRSMVDFDAATSEYGETATRQ